MPRIFKFFVIFFSGICALSIAVILLFGFLASKSLPDYNRLVNTPLIEDEINVYRDNYAVPNIQGKTNKDVFFALGYVHAQDRLWQMLLLRRTAQGKLSEYFGEDTLDTDILMRTLNIYNQAHESASHLSIEVLDLMNSYSNGVNQRLNDIRKEGLGRGTPNLFLFPPEVAPWSPTDSIAILKLLAIQNNESAKKEVIRLNLLKSGISIKRLSDLFLGMPDISKSTTFLNLELLWEPKANILSNSETKINTIFANSIFTPNLGTINASNIWASMPPRTASGNTLVGYNLHTNFEIPLTWMLAKLNLESGAVIGVTVPGIPAILTGRSKYLSWGIASSNLDNQDLIIEKINPTNPEEYLDAGYYRKFQKRNVLIKIRGKPGLTHTIKSTSRGPIIPPEAYGIETLTLINKAVALRWTGFDTKDRSIESFIAAMKAENIQVAKAAFKHLVVPSYNVLLAEPGNVMIVSAGKIPNRIERAGEDFGVIPSLGWENPMDWSGYLGFNENPYIIDPPEHILFNTNNKLLNNGYPKHFSYDWGDNQRQLRMKDLFQTRKVHSLNSFQEIQSDIVSSSARTVLPLLAKNLWYSQTLNLTNDLANLRKRALELLAEWNGEMSVHLSQPLIYNSWASHFQRMIIQDELGAQIHWFKSVKPDFLERVLRNIDGAGIWCDIKQTKRIESCDNIALMSLDNSLVTNSKLLGPNIAKWRWGDHHKARFMEKVIGRYPVISYLSNIVYEIPGGDNTLSMARSLRSSSNLHDVRYGSTLRVIFDMSNPDHSFFSMPTGQSGHLFSKHYDDLLSLWETNDYLQIYLDDSPIKAASSSVMNFKRIN